MREVPILDQLVPKGMENGRGKITVTPDAKISLLGQRLSHYLFCQIIEFSPRPELIKRGQYAVMSWFAEAFAEPSLSSLQVIDLSAWNLEPSWESAIRTFAFAHPNLVQLREIRIGRRAFHAKGDVEAWEQTKNAAMQEVADEYENGPGKGLYLDKDAHPAQRLQWLRFTQLYHLVKLGDPAYVQEVSEVLKMIRDPRVSRKAMRGSVLPMERPGGYPHALRLEAARVFVEAVELSGSGELAEVGVKNLREILMKPTAFSKDEGMIREDLFPFLLRLLPYLPTDSIEVTAGFSMLATADWIRAWGEADPNLQVADPPVAPEKNLDEVYRERPEAVVAEPRKIHPCIQVGLAYAGYLAAASPFQLELSRDLRADISKQWSAWILSDMGAPSEEVVRAVAIWAKHHDKVARDVERLPINSGLRDGVAKARNEVERVSRRRLDELMDKRAREWGANTGIGFFMKFLLGLHSPWDSLSQSNQSKSEITDRRK